MPLSPNAPATTSRKGTIPRDFISSWQCSGIRSAKQVARRPKTACVSCRTARVKCNGQRDCERCTNQGIACRYAVAATNPEGSNRSQQTTQLPQSGEMSMDLNLDTTDQLRVENDAYEQALGTVTHWPNEVPQRPAEQYDALAPQMNQDVRLPHKCGIVYK